MESKEKSNGSSSLAGSVANMIDGLGKKLDKDLDKYIESRPIEIKPAITFDQCIEYAKKIKAKKPEVAAVILVVENIEMTPQCKEHVKVTIGFKDTNGKVLSGKDNTVALGTVMRVETIDMKFLDYLKGQNSITITF